MGNMLSGVALSTMSPAQKRCMRFLQEYISKILEGEAGR